MPLYTSIYITGTQESITIGSVDGNEGKMNFNMATFPKDLKEASLVHNENQSLVTEYVEEVVETVEKSSTSDEGLANQRQSSIKLPIIRKPVVASSDLDDDIEATVLKYQQKAAEKCQGKFVISLVIHTSNLSITFI